MRFLWDIGKQTRIDLLMGKWASACWLYLSMRRLVHLLQRGRWPSGRAVWHCLCAQQRAAGKKISDILACLKVFVIHLQQQCYASPGNSSSMALSSSVPKPKVPGCVDPLWCWVNLAEWWELKYYSMTSEPGTTKSMENWSWDWRFQWKDWLEWE